MPNSNLERLKSFRDGKSKNAKVEVKCKLCGKTWVMWRSHYYRGDNPCDCRHWRKNNPRLYRIYTNMKTRCYNNKSPNYKNYGGRGVSMCDEWRNSFECFLNWAMSNGYSDSLTIERVDVNGNYEPANCTWVTQEQQANNKTNTVRVGDMSLRRWCILHSLNYKLVHQYTKRHPELTVSEVADKYLELGKDEDHESNADGASA